MNFCFAFAIVWCERVLTCNVSSHIGSVHTVNAYSSASNTLSVYFLIKTTTVAFFNVTGKNSIYHTLLLLLRERTSPPPSPSNPSIHTHTMSNSCLNYEPLLIPPPRSNTVMHKYSLTISNFETFNAKFQWIKKRKKWIIWRKKHEDEDEERRKNLIMNPEDTTHKFPSCSSIVIHHYIHRYLLQHWAPI